MRTIVVGVLLLLMSVWVLIVELTSFRCNLAVVTIVGLAVVGVGLLAAGVTSALRTSGNGREA